MPDPLARRHLFISYSRADRSWVDRLRQVMAPLLREAGDAIQLWDDSQIRPGALWLDEIEAALAGARVALLLVSAEFLASEFVMRREVPKLLAAAHRDGVRILWVNLSPSLVEHTPIHAYQAVLPPEPCLAEMGEVEQRRALTRIAQEVHRALEESAERQRRLAEEERQRQLARQQEEARQEAAEQARQQAQREAEEKAQRLAEEERQRQQPVEDLPVQRAQKRLRNLVLGMQQGQQRREAQAQELRSGRVRISRRKMLIGVAGLPLVAMGVGALRSLQQRFLPPGPFPLSTSTGKLLRIGNAWKVYTSPIRVAMHREPLAPGLDLRLLAIRPGRFTMGSPAHEIERGSDEGPPHEVRLEAFLLGQTPITQAQWRVVAGWPPVDRALEPAPSFFKGDNRPVEQVSWLDAMEFCKRLSQRTGRFYTLPSEAQWEYACRAGSTTPFAFGATLTDQLANYRASSTYGDGPKGEYREQTTPVGMFPANAWGLHDMHGNVWEWCLDHWHDSYAGAPSDGSAWLKPSASDEESRLLRGGSWDVIPRYCRSAYRNHSQPGNALSLVGFRVVCLPQGPSLNP